MQITKCTTAADLGAKAGKLAAQKIREAIEKKGEARIILSTGSSQFETLATMVSEDVDWSRVVMFHLDEYVGLPESHIASFRKYLKERFINIVHPKEAYLVDGDNPADTIKFLTEKICEKEIDVALIGIGENAHIAFNDPPADFDTKESYIIVNLDEKCRKQQVGEGWFATVDDVPKQAISMTPYRIMQSKVIISSVPHAVKTNAIDLTLGACKTTNLIPATLLKEHGEWYLFVDENSGKNVK